MPSSSTGQVSAAISAHGTLIYRNGTQIGELRNITPPPITRNNIETTSQNSSDDSYVVGIRRKGELSFEIGFLPSGDSTHDSLAGLVKAWHDGSNDLYLLTFPDSASWQFSGYVSSIAPDAPVDGGLVAKVGIRPSGGHIFLP